MKKSTKIILGTVVSGVALGAVSGGIYNISTQTNNIQIQNNLKVIHEKQNENSYFMDWDDNVGNMIEHGDTGFHSYPNYYFLNNKWQKNIVFR